jgi:hypothetical protein
VRNFIESKQRDAKQMKEENTTYEDGEYDCDGECWNCIYEDECNQE